MGFLDNPIIYLSRLLWKYSKGNRKNVILYFTLFVFGNLIGLLDPLILAKILNIIQEQGITAQNYLTIIGYASLFIAVSIGYWIFHGPARYIEEKNAFLVRANYKKYLIDGTMQLSANWHSNHHSGDTIDKIEKGTNALYNYATETFLVIETLIRLIGSYIALAYFNLHSIYIVLFVVILTVYIIIKFDQKLVKQYIKLNKHENKISAKIFDVISNITTVIILRIQKLVSIDIVRKIMAPFSLYKKNLKINETKWFFVSMCSTLLTFLILSSYIYSNFKAGNIILIGTIAALFGYVSNINNLFFRFAYKYGSIVRQRAKVTNVQEISDIFDKKKKIKQASLKNWEKIEIKNLQFSYHGKNDKNQHINNISFDINKSEKIAFIGESGSGKTTLLKLIRELYHPNKINLFIDNQKIEHGFKAISSYISLIPQDPEIFSTTIKKNITMTLPHTPEEIKKYTDMAMFTKVIKRLPKKINSSIFEKGVNLSGGEKQRLALSRGLLASIDKQILLLDEPTSSVDSKNEMQIYQNIFTKYKNKTIISSIHRLHLLYLFDRVIFFRNGKIIANGTFQSLLKTSPQFKQLWNKYKRTQ
jgi:ABC-type multidrug transport system fused ATPase/permease subunit